MPTEKKIFVMSPDILLQQEFSRIAEESGVEISVHPGRGEILAELEKNSSAEILLLVEISGAGHEGIQLAEDLKEKFSSVNMIAFSKLIAPDTVRRAKNAGIQHIVTQAQLLEMLPKLLKNLAG